MKPIFTIGIPCSIGKAGYEAVKEIISKNKPLEKDYHLFIYLLKSTNEWKFILFNSEKDIPENLKEVMEKLEALES